MKNFKNYEEVQQWITQKSKEYGSKNAFLSSEEYKKHYSLIISIFKGEQIKFKEKAERAMSESKIQKGDKVSYDIVDPWHNVTELKGVVVLRSGIPYVKLNQTSARNVGKTFVKWHKGFKKVK